MQNYSYFILKRNKNYESIASDEKKHDKAKIPDMFENSKNGMMFWWKTCLN